MDVAAPKPVAAPPAKPFVFPEVPVYAETVPTGDGPPPKPSLPPPKPSLPPASPPLPTAAMVENPGFKSLDGVDATASSTDDAPPMLSGRASVYEGEGEGEEVGEEAPAVNITPAGQKPKNKVTEMKETVVAWRDAVSMHLPSFPLPRSCICQHPRASKKSSQKKHDTATSSCEKLATHAALLLLGNSLSASAPAKNGFPKTALKTSTEPDKKQHHLLVLGFLHSCPR
jgi:hypothetical protein